MREATKQFWIGFRSGLELGGAVILWPFSKRARQYVKDFVLGEIP
jgi:hypothetical protein